MGGAGAARSPPAPAPNGATPRHDRAGRQGRPAVRGSQTRLRLIAPSLGMLRRIQEVHALTSSGTRAGMLAPASPFNTPWLPPGYGQKLWKAAQVVRTLRRSSITSTVPVTTPNTNPRTPPTARVNTTPPIPCPRAAGLARPNMEANAGSLLTATRM